MKTSILVTLALVATIAFAATPSVTSIENPPVVEVATTTSEISATSTEKFEEIKTVDTEILELRHAPVKKAGQYEITQSAYMITVENRTLGIQTLPETWILALEWCESRGDNTAINHIDRDGTASYYAFQFKPSTFRSYGEKYGVIEKGLSDVALMNALAVYENAYAVVWNMMSDPSVVWENQFPDCVKNHIGLPPDMSKVSTFK